MNFRTVWGGGIVHYVKIAEAHITAVIYNEFCGL